MVKDQISRRGVPKSPSNTCATPLRLFCEVEYPREADEWPRVVPPSCKVDENGDVTPMPDDRYQRGEDEDDQE